jgi:hypothetical protein
MYDTSTGRVYYSGMTMPIGTVFGDTASDSVILQFVYDNDRYNGYDVTYAEMQELLGTYNGN